MHRVKKPKVILLDIEGTTTSTSYYPKLVAPYIRKNTESYLKSNWNEEHIQSIVRDLRESARSYPNIPKIVPTKGSTVGAIQESVLKHIETLYREDVSTMALLYFQMYVWLDGQMKGLLKTHIFKDAAEMMYRWKHENKITIYIYSSARADVQMLMFACTEVGSLIHLIDGHFDSKIGRKTSTLTYHRISQMLKVPPQDILFLTDGVEEARASKKAGVKAILVARDRKVYTPVTSSQFEVVNSFRKVKFFS